jgi:transcriptional regulator with XRE-family HTH domain
MTLLPDPTFEELQALYGDAGSLTDPGTIGGYIRIARRKLGITERELAVLMNVTFKDVSQVENNRITPDDDLIERFAESLSLSTDVLYFLAGRLPLDLRIQTLNVNRVRAAFNAMRLTLEVPTHFSEKGK